MLINNISTSDKTSDKSLWLLFNDKRFNVIAEYN
jgi:hypothetical protein